MIWDILNSLLRITITLIVVYKLTQFTGMMIKAERAGLGLMASGSLMTVPIIWYGQRSPFDGWAVTVMTGGAVLFLLGRTYRDYRHQRANDLQVKWHEAHQRGRGK